MRRTPARRQASASRATSAGSVTSMPGRSLDQRLDHHGGELAGVAVDGGHRLVGPAGVVVAGGADHGEAQRVEDVGPEATVAQRERAHGVPVVGVAERQIAGAARHAAC